PSERPRLLFLPVKDGASRKATGKELVVWRGFWFGPLTLRVYAFFSSLSFLDDGVTPRSRIDTMTRPALVAAVPKTLSLASVTPRMRGEKQQTVEKNPSDLIPADEVRRLFKQTQQELARKDAQIEQLIKALSLREDEPRGRRGRSHDRDKDGEDCRHRGPSPAESVTSVVSSATHASHALFSEEKDIRKSLIAVIPMYLGEGATSLFFTWTAALKWVFNFSPTSERGKIVLATSYLTSAALKWWNVYKTHVESGVLCLHEQLNSCTQDSCGNLAAYNQKMQDLYLQISGESDTSWVAKYFRGLRPSLRPLVKMNLSNLDSFQKVMAAANRLADPSETNTNKNKRTGPTDASASTATSSSSSSKQKKKGRKAGNVQNNGGNRNNNAERQPCSHCDQPEHSVQQCWQHHPELRPNNNGNDNCRPAARVAETDAERRVFSAFVESADDAIDDIMDTTTSPSKSLTVHERAGVEIEKP
ncbi:MAG: hypothetical protein BJ554DRAFT_7870, partial [Olpidium bornovanus]